MKKMMMHAVLFIMIAGFAAFFSACESENEDENGGVIQVTYIVTFNSNGGSSVQPQTVPAGGKATKPPNPTRTGYTFDAWYVSTTGNTKYDFNAPVNANISIYARWTSGTSPKAAKPTASPAAGSYTSAQSVTLLCDTAGSTIRYTIDGQDPTSTSPQYSGAINISSTTTLKARAFRSGYTESDVMTAVYTINGKVAMPTASLPTGTYTVAQSVTLSCTTQGSTIRYTTNGVDPTSSSTLYNGPINISATTTLKARAFSSGSTDSDVMTVVYTLNTDGGGVLTGGFRDISAITLVSEIKFGLNLGNQLDAHYSNGTTGVLASYNGTRTVDSMETAWVKVTITRATITALKNAGFNAIRIPVTWHKAADPAGNNYTIRPEWMARVKEIVDYAVAEDMYIMLNTHHDEFIFGFMNDNAVAGRAAFGKIWTQIANTFKGYNEKLIFEGLNEPRRISDNNMSTPPAGAVGQEIYANINSYYQVFVDTVRATGGNNTKRMLVVNPYGASNNNSSMNALQIPSDPIGSNTGHNKIIVSYHSYTPPDFCFPWNTDATTWSETDNGSSPYQGSGISWVKGAIDQYSNKFTPQGIPVILGEWGCVNKNNTLSRVAYSEYVIKYATSKNQKCFWWDNHSDTFNGDFEGFGIFDRSNNTFRYPTIIDAFKRGAGIN